MKKTCVIIDDDPTFLLLFRNMLSKIKWIDLLQEFDNPVKGATAVIIHQPDFVIVDYMMPYMNGTDLIDWLTPQLLTMDNPPKMMVLSGNTEDECNNLALANGFLCKRELTKPNKLEEKLLSLMDIKV